MAKGKSMVHKLDKETQRRHFSDVNGGKGDRNRTLVRELERFPQAEMIWCQEEPKNQGAWTFMEPNLEWVLGRIKAKHLRPVYVGRAASASPATGLASTHKAQQQALVDEALTIKGN